ncbi:MAG: protein kinase [Chloroflexi bacterium]|nr:protein kinase [Chloroflexota bacterium]
MTSERVQRRIDGLLDQAESAADRLDWEQVAQCVRMVLRIEPDNADALVFQTMLEGEVREDPAREVPAGKSGADMPGAPDMPPDAPGGETEPTSFAGGRYQVSKFLGEGGKKRVYQAHDTLLDREVAFALIKTEGFDETSKERISREAQAMGRLGVHPNIVAVLDLGQEDDGTPYMVTELMGGGDVEGLLAETTPEPPPESGGGKLRPPPREGGGLEVGRDLANVPAASARAGLPLDRTIEIGKAVCEGLEFAHARGIVHRDLKPGNVWLTEDGIAKIGDFGLAVMTDRSRLTREGMMVGTVSYMPPEQATGGEITPKADLYSLGAMLYEMVTGRPPFLGDDEIAIIGQHINTPPVAPTWHNGKCPRPLEALIMRMLAKDPSERPESAQDVFNALDAIDLTARGETVEHEGTSLDSLAGGVFVGRQAEMDQLKAALEDVLGGRGRLVMLVGEPGIGKTRISEELATYAGLRGAQVLWGRCYETGGQPPYWPWVQAIRSYVREADPEELRRQMGSSASIVAEIVTDLKERLPDLQPPPQLDDPDSTRFRLFDGIASFLKTAGQTRPLVIVLDDLHWADQPSLTFLEFMARELGQSRVLLLCTYRDMELNRRHPLSVTLGDLARERLYERVLLRGLSEHDVARFIEIAAGFSAPAELSATVHRHTEGNPLFVTEVVRELVQSGELAENRASGESTWSVRIPEGVREVIGRRLDRLSDRANEILITAAVIGRDFHLDAVKELAEDTSEGQLLDVLDEALDAKIIEELTDAVDHYQFTHALMQETLTGELSITRRVRLHARIAETLERLHGDEAEENAAELAYHFGEAEAVLGTEKLVRYSVVAGSKAFDSAGFEDARHHYQIAYAVIKDGDRDVRLATVLSGLGRTICTVPGDGGIQEGWDLIARAFDTYLELGDSSSAIELALFPAMFGPLTGTANVLRRALEIADPSSIEAGRLNTRYNIALLDDESDLAAARVALDRAAVIAEDQGDLVLKARVLAHRVQAAAAAGDLRGMVALGDAYVEATTAADDDYCRVRFGPWLARAYLGTGNREMANQLIEVALDASMRVKNPIHIRGNLISKAELLLTRGDYDQALELDISPEIGRRGGFIRWLVEADTGRNEDDAAGFPIPDFDFLGDVNSMPWRQRSTLVEMIAIVGRDTSNLELLELVRATLRAVDPEYKWLPREQIPLAVARGFLADAEGDRPAAERAYEELSGYSGIASGESFVPYDRLLGLLASLLGRHDDAVQHFENALELCRQAEFRPQHAWTCSDYAEMLLDRDEHGDHEKAIELQDEALAITQELGMRPLTERILARREILRA